MQTRILHARHAMHASSESQVPPCNRHPITLSAPIGHSARPGDLGILSAGPACHPIIGQKVLSAQRVCRHASHFHSRILRRAPRPSPGRAGGEYSKFRQSGNRKIPMAAHDEKLGGTFGDHGGASTLEACPLNRAAFSHNTGFLLDRGELAKPCSSNLPLRFWVSCQQVHYHLYNSPMKIHSSPQRGGQPALTMPHLVAALDTATDEAASGGIPGTAGESVARSQTKGRNTSPKDVRLPLDGAFALDHVGTWGGYWRIPGDVPLKGAPTRPSLDIYPLVAPVRRERRSEPFVSARKRHMEGN
jgi:hypothetical protein